jgi:signal transduction histidine kinase
MNKTGAVKKQRSRIKKISFKLHPRVFAALGTDLVTSDVVAIIELVKNSYDALASRVDVRVTVDEPLIEVTDDGVGMTRFEIENVWSVVATPYKLNAPMKGGRRVSGEKGLGRLSAARLGNQLEMITKAQGQPCWRVRVNWPALASSKNISDCNIELTRYAGKLPFDDTGTCIRITDLKSEWTEERIDDLAEQLSRLISPFDVIDDFKILLHAPGSSPKPIAIEAPEFLAKPPYRIKGEVNQKGVVKCVYSCGNVRRKRIEEKLWWRVLGFREESDEAKEPSPPQCGSFAFEIRAWDIDSESVREIANNYSLGRRDVTQGIRNYKGISVYRDKILVLPKSETARDWLGLDLRRVSRVGGRLSTSQLVGYVSISSEKNPSITDTSDRERLVENPATQDFKRLLKGVVELLEDERERDRTKPGHQEPPLKELFASLSATPLLHKIQELSSTGRSAAEAIPFVEQYNSKLQDAVTQIERRLVYYSRVASLGVLAASIVHEVRNQTINIGRLLAALGRFRSDPENPLVVIEKEISLAERAVQSLDQMAKRFAPLATRSSSSQKSSTVEEIISECLQMRQEEIEKKSVEVQPPDTHTTVAVNPGELTAIIINFLDNSLFWLSAVPADDRQIEFSVERSPNGRVEVQVHDSGPGVTAGDEERIFWPGVTSKPGGLGMGLTVASELVSQVGGATRLIVPGILGGASFAFDLPAERVKQ